MIKKVGRILLKILWWYLGLSIFSVLLFRFVPVPYTPLMATRAFENIIEGKELEFSHDWVPIEDISPNLQRAVIAAEDGTFLEHNGFDFKAMKLAYQHNSKGKRIKGGSTISQQTAKNVFLWQGRSYVRKVLEAYFTVLIELFWGKERIMEVYLNSIEMGTNVYGAEAAARHYFEKPASDLTRREAASIAAILPNPRKYKATNSSAYIERRKSRIMKHMRYIGKLDY